MRQARFGKVREAFQLSKFGCKANGAAALLRLVVQQCWKKTPKVAERRLLAQQASDLPCYGLPAAY
jgi:hypothetical protein